MAEERRSYEEICSELEMLRTRARQTAVRMEDYKRLYSVANQVLHAVVQDKPIAGPMLYLQGAVHQIEKAAGSDA